MRRKGLNQTMGALLLVLITAVSGVGASSFTGTIQSGLQTTTGGAALRETVTLEAGRIVTTGDLTFVVRNTGSIDITLGSLFINDRDITIPAKAGLLDGRTLKVDETLAEDDILLPGSVIRANSIILAGSTLNKVTLTDTTLASDTLVTTASIIKAGSTLKVNSTLIEGDGLDGRPMPAGGRVTITVDGSDVLAALNLVGGTLAPGSAQTLKLTSRTGGVFSFTLNVR